MMLRPIRVLGVIGSLLVLTSNYIILMLIISLGMSKGMVIGVGLVFLYVIYLILKLVWKAELNVYSILHKQKTYNKTDKS